ncbi:MAG: hypothetical protein QOF30_2918 [Acidimicrobiaceae bacterium]|nr:hypothetical protein [Acidimicrobiaceae bacterium]
MPPTSEHTPATSGATADADADADAGGIPAGGIPAGGIAFRATVDLNGKTATGIVVPDEFVAALAAGKRPKVQATINDYTYRSSVASMGGRFLLPVSADVRAAAGVAAGDEVDVRLEVDGDVRQVAVPPALAAALDADDSARRRFEGLSYSAQLRYVLSVEGAKTEDTRTRRIAKALAELDGGPASPPPPHQR